MRAHFAPLVRAWTWASIFLIEALREAYDSRLHPFLLSLRKRPPTARAMRRFVEALLGGEAQLEKLIRNAAARELGLPIDRRPWRAFLRVMPHRGFRTLMACVRRHRRLLADPERAIQRRIARILSAFATTPLAMLRADAAASALRASLHPELAPAAPAALPALAPLAARPP